MPPLFPGVLDIYSSGLKNDEMKKDFLKCFSKYEALSAADKLMVRYCYFIGHYDSNKKNRKQWCSIREHEIAHIKFNHPLFNVYKLLISKYVKASSYRAQMEIRFKLEAILIALSWPVQFINEKINQDSTEIHLLDKSIPPDNHVTFLKYGQM